MLVIWSTISEALKERNIILETNDQLVADGFTQVPNFNLKNKNLTVGRRMTIAMFLSTRGITIVAFGARKTAEDIGVTRAEREYLHQRPREKRLLGYQETGQRKDEHLHRAL